jgi:hypothetical protein
VVVVVTQLIQVQIQVLRMDLVVQEVVESQLQTLEHQVLQVEKD